MKIKFLAFSYTKPYSFNPIYYWLKSFYKKNGKHFDEYEWLPTEYFYDKSVVDRIIDEDAEILCLSVYLWNFESLMKVAQKAKAKNPNLLILVGGPECHANTEQDWFLRYPFVDFAIYGDGEKAFKGLLDWFKDPSISVNDIPNIIHAGKKNRHEIFRFRDWPEYSPILDLSDEFLNDYNTFKSKVNGVVYMPYERTRGCMYACAFCDWQAGLHYKVNTRINDYKKEIDFLAEHKMRTQQVDANVGMMKEDIPMYEYVSKKIKDHELIDLPVEPRNMAKLHKDKVAKIYDILCDASPKYNVKVSIQSIYEDVLENIDRPDVPWVEHKKIIQKLKAKHPHANIIAELIMGLPGLTFDRILETHLELATVPMAKLFSYEWILLKKSPAYSAKYREQHGLTTTKTFYPSTFGSGGPSLIKTEDFLKDPNIPVQKNQAYNIDMVYGEDLDIQGVIYNKILTKAYNTFISEGKVDGLFSYLNNNNQYFMEVSEKEAETQKQFLNQYGVFLWGTIEGPYIHNYENTLDGYIKNVRNI